MPPTNAGLMFASSWGGADSSDERRKHSKHSDADDGSRAAPEISGSSSERTSKRSKQCLEPATASNVLVNEFVAVYPEDFQFGPFWVGKVVKKPPASHGKKVLLQWHHTENKKFPLLGKESKDWDSAQLSGLTWHRSMHACVTDARHTGDPVCTKPCPLKNKYLEPGEVPILSCLSQSFRLTGTSTIPAAVAGFVQSEWMRRQGAK